MKPLTIGMFSLLLVLLFPSPAVAVCLLDDYSVTSEYARSEAVIVARVLSSQAIPDQDDPLSNAGVVYAVKLLEAFRGVLGGVVDVYSENSSGRFPLKEGETYLLFLYRQQGRLSADYCGNSGLIAQTKKQLAELRQVRKGV